MEGKLRKITLGTDPINGKALAIGTFIKGLQSTVVEIVHDKNYFTQVGKERYSVFLKNKVGVKYLWQRFTDIPCAEEFSDPGEEPEHHN